MDMTMMNSGWWLVLSSGLGLVGIGLALWKGGSVFASALSKRPFWIVCYHHQQGMASWPVFCKDEPDLDYLLKTDQEFAGDWEGEDSGEYVDIDGPWYVGMRPYQKP